MKPELRKYRALAWAAAALFVTVYVCGYAYSRHQRLSFEYAASRMLFSSQEQAERWREDFDVNRKSMPLDYSDSEFQYMLFWPVIRVDSLVTGRAINSPFKVRPYVIPNKQESSQQQTAPEL